MWDLKLNNSCNHRIINEPLDIKGSYPSYYAILKRPVYGNNLQIKLVDEDNLFEVNPVLLFCTLGNDKKTLVLNTSEIQVDIRDGVYPKHSYYATYVTDQAHCPKCIEGTNKTNDINKILPLGSKRRELAKKVYAAIFGGMLVVWR